MRRTLDIPSRVYRCLFPYPINGEPKDFAQFLTDCLITEVRVETHRFYGGLELIEAKYPGLDYAYPPHRKRLSYFPHHARLFAAFDHLRLTPYEIHELCKWEGTLWARERYERDERTIVHDTTGDDIRPAQRRWKIPSTGISAQPSTRSITPPESDCSSSTTDALHFSPPQPNYSRRPAVSDLPSPPSSVDMSADLASKDEPLPGIPLPQETPICPS